jgi:AraC-like DNA-binding protein
MSDTEHRRFRRALAYIHDRIDSDLRLERVASAISVSVPTLKRAFRAACDHSPGRVIRRLRMEAALAALRVGRTTVLDAALACGFSDHSAFSRRFKKAFGIVPAHACRGSEMPALECLPLAPPERLELPELTVQAVTERGRYFECAPRAWESLRSRLGGRTVPAVFVGIGHDDPHRGTAVRYSAGICSGAQLPGLRPIVIPAGERVGFPFCGKLPNLGLAYHTIYGSWAKREGVRLDPRQPAIVWFDAFPRIDGEVTAKILVPVADGRFEEEP